MKRPNLSHVGCLALSAFLLSCATPDVRIAERPLANSPTDERGELDSSSAAVLRRDGLRSLYRSDPHAAIKSLHQRYEREGGQDRLMAVAELCGALGVEYEKTAPNAAAGCYLDAARLSRPAAFGSGSGVHDRQLKLIYNVSCASLAALLHEQRHDWARTARFDGPLARTSLSQGHAATGDIDPKYFDELVPADRIVLEHVDLDHKRQDGVGGALVGHHLKREKAGGDERFISPGGLALPVNACLEFPGDGRAVVVLRDLLEADHVRVAGKDLPLNADWTAVIGYMYRYAPKKNVGFLGMLHPEEFSDETNLYRVSRFNPDKIPVIMVHGLMSSPETWIAALNELRADPVYRRHFQTVLFRYPTGYSIVRNGGAFRKKLAEFRATYDSPQSGANMRRTVIVCHSMGGNLTDLQIRHSGDSLRKLFFEKPIEELEVSNEQQAVLRSLFVFEPNPDIERVVFLAAPHRGSKIASNPIGELGDWLIKVPSQIANSGLSFAELLELPGLSSVGRVEAESKLDSVRSLRPDNPLYPVVMAMPVGKRVTYHSVIGQVNQSKPRAEGTDKVVQYWSSHLDGAASEKIVDASHTQITGDADSIAEVRRLLYLHINADSARRPGD